MAFTAEIYVRALLAGNGDLLLRCRFMNMVHTLQAPWLTWPAASAANTQSLDGMQEGDRASMLMVSLVVRPLSKAIAEQARLSLDRRHVDNCILIGSLAKLQEGVESLCSRGLDDGLFLNPAKTRLFLSSQSFNR
eukprot:GFKZ01002758.1.p3 GENE.GFKZ01002758.1~~GFKZ01002758.1.p3  ORF type:complete len:135 (-),score=16.79 GFKZ01002758.1:3280-3684(-)